MNAVNIICMQMKHLCQEGKNPADWNTESMQWLALVSKKVISKYISEAFHRDRKNNYVLMQRNVTNLYITRKISIATGKKKYY